MIAPRPPAPDGGPGAGGRDTGQPLIQRHVESRERVLCHAGPVKRAWLSTGAGVALVAVACVLPCWTFTDLAGAALPYQDPTPEMLAEQTAEVSQLQKTLMLQLSIAAPLTLLGALALIYGVRRWRGRYHTGHGDD